MRLPHVSCLNYTIEFAEKISHGPARFVPDEFIRLTLPSNFNAEDPPAGSDRNGWAAPNRNNGRNHSGIRKVNQVGRGVGKGSCKLNRDRPSS